ncbi:MAG: CsgG/HfaB family protein [Gemmatimonadales bacterium]
MLRRLRRSSIPLALGVAVQACAVGGGASLTPAAVVAADSALEAAIATERSIDPASFPPRTIGVAPFRVSATDTSLAVLGYGLADLLITDLSRSASLRVVDRLRVDAFLRETGLVARGFVDSATAPRLGRLIGARQIVSGAVVAPSPSEVRLDGRLGDVASGLVRAVRGASSSLDRILDAEKDLAFAIFERLGVTLSPAERALVEQRPTRHLAALLAYSRGIRDEARGDFRSARRQYRDALERDPGFANPAERLAQLGSALGADRLVVERAGILAVEGINRRMPPNVVGAGDPAFRQQLTGTVIIILSLP